MKHPHAEIIKALADDDSLMLWRKHHTGSWYAIYHNKIELVAASPGGQFHIGPTRPPRMIETPYGSYPEPLRETPEIGTECWLVDSRGYTVCIGGWANVPSFRRYLSSGTLHATKEAAEQQAQVELKRRMAELGWEKS